MEVPLSQILNIGGMSRNTTLLARNITLMPGRPSSLTVPFQNYNIIHKSDLFFQVQPDIYFFISLNWSHFHFLS